VRFLNAVFLTIVISPAFVRGFTLLSQTGAVAQEYASRLTNFVLAHYLNDSVTIQPSKFEHLLGLRSALVEAFLDFETSGAVFMATIASGGFLLVLVRFCAVSTGLTALSWTVFYGANLGICNCFCRTRCMDHSQRTACGSVISCCALRCWPMVDLKMSLTHQFQYLRQGDIEWEIALAAMRPLFFWNPALILGRGRWSNCENWCLINRCWRGKALMSGLIATAGYGSAERVYAAIQSHCFWSLSYHLGWHINHVLGLIL
jgi:hypothetical protein